MREPFKKLFILLFLSLLSLSAFFTRLENFKNSPARTIDEVVYYRMADQILNHGLQGYNSIPYAQELTAQGRALPKYFFQPIFKYPPLFSLMLALAMKVLGPTLVAAYSVILLTGILIIPLTFLLGTVLYNRFVGLLAASLIFMDPVSIICSQKVWMETTLAFFTLASLLLFILALKKKNDVFFILAGILAGLATLTKYPGILLIGAYTLYAGLHHKELFRNRSFIMGLFIPVIMLIPWAYWNWNIYGCKIFEVELGFHSSPAHQKQLIARTIVAFLIILSGIFCWKITKERKKITDIVITFFSKNRQRWLNLLTILIGLFLFKDYLLRALDVTSLPLVSWASGIFYYASPIFYLGRLLEFSLIYLFAYAFFFFPIKESYKEIAVLKTTLVVLLAFYIFWGNYQSRYILACVPLFLVLASRMIEVSLEKARTLPHPLGRMTCLFILVLFISYAIMKTYFINLNLSFPNNLCYF